MASKRAHTPELIANPFIKKRNLEWSLELTGSSLDAETDSSNADEDAHEPKPDAPGEDKPPRAAAIEAGEAQVDDHLKYFSDLLCKATLSPFPEHMPHLSIPAYRQLYESNFGDPCGAHFIVHQHDHPIAGTHYDLRLQINPSSSASWAIMYGLPGDPNSVRLNRNATETRVHCLWNHLVETASGSTGSLLIWDTGTYEVLPHAAGRRNPTEDPDSQPLSSQESAEQPTQQERLHRAFQARKIRIRLNGARLPRDYVLNLRLTRDEDIAGRAKSGRKPKTRRRRGGMRTRARAPEPMTSSDSDVGSDTGTVGGVDGDDETVNAPVEADQQGLSAMEREIRELEDAEVRRTNAYTGASNTIDSVHQRKWFLSLDREACGFVKRKQGGRSVWEREKDDPPPETNDGADGRLSFPFYVRGAEVERSVVTGRRGAEVLRDEGVVGFVKRKGWQAVLN
ncbi:hypothetical protein JX265_005969 [Neoarthrinium moseri]|uniref:DNA ligase D 3'-phosphoesterase domain-containing protein n=1 Tax=Neoarthrinium moseri TaxID=1658444 RepID=A0A9Q0APU1_9PEZI|nr:hypothetical protein JX265_005969 [Neoarthrinium moseri]